jgi:hypothetical protein
MTHLVPGEADIFCARYLLDNGGIVITADSDLLAHDIGNGSVVLIHEIRRNNQTEAEILVANKFPVGDISRTLGLPIKDGLRRLAFGLLQDQHITLNKLLEITINKPVDSVEYARFSQEYSAQDLSCVHLKSSLCARITQSQYMDARVSELLLQFLDHESHIQPTGRLGSQVDERRGELMMFLPPLIECPSRGSAWQNSTAIRQLAYSIPQFYQQANRSHVSEYRRVTTATNRGKQIQLHSKAETVESAGDLLHLINPIAEIGIDLNKLWQAFSVQLDIKASAEQGREPLCKVVRKNRKYWKSQRDVIPWEMVHSNAQMQACFYSLRMLQQLLTLAGCVGESPMPLIFEKLRQSLDSLPGLADFPTIASTHDFYDNLKGLELQALANVVSCPGVRRSSLHMLDGEITEKKRGEKEKNCKRKSVGDGEREGSSTKAGALRSVNPFDVLG